MSGEGTAAVRGWGCTPTETPDAIKPRFLPAAFVRGWQRTALYVILIVLMMLVFLNIALTLWIIASLRLSMSSIGPIKIVNGGIQIDGQSFVTDRLVASTISSRPGQPITLHSHRNFTVLVSDPNQAGYSKLLIKRDSLECGGRAFDVVDAQGNNVFRATREEVKVYSDIFSVESSGGLNARSAVQTPTVRAPPGSDLLLESQTRRLDLRAPQSIYLESRAGSLEISSHGNIDLNSDVGAIKMNAQNIYMSKLREAMVFPNITRTKPLKTVKVYQVCVCSSSGKLFLAAADGLCAAHVNDKDLCR